MAAIRKEHDNPLKNKENNIPENSIPEDSKDEDSKDEDSEGEETDSTDVKMDSDQIDNDSTDVETDPKQKEADFMGNEKNYKEDTTEDEGTFIILFWPKWLNTQKIDMGYLIILAIIIKIPIKGYRV